MLSLLLTGLAAASIVSASPDRLDARSKTTTSSSAAPTVSLGYATFRGLSTGDTESFLGMPYAYPPVGTNRLQLPKAPKTYSGIQDATAYGDICVQQHLSDTGTLGNLPVIADEILAGFGLTDNVTSGSEDCLSINVIKPTSASNSAKLPVLVWLYGGGFEFGGSSSYNGSTIVERSVLHGSPVIFVSLNYRLNAFGFLGGKEVKEAGVGNLGLQDQRFALKWIQDHVCKFGGDPEKVTIWGESAGAISVALQMLTNDGKTEGLFRAGYMESGSPLPVGNIDNKSGQEVYDTVVKAAGCSSAKDTLECLRKVDFATFNAAMNANPNVFSYSALHNAYLPRADGVFLKSDPQYLVKEGKYAHIPIISGDDDDEGTLFSLTQTNDTTPEETIAYFHENYFPDATKEQMAKLAAAYPSNPALGSPYNTNTSNELTPQYKRIASLQGDYTFQAPRRYFLSFASKTQDVWSYVNTRGKATPFLGAYHSSEVSVQYFTSNTTTDVNYEALDYLINFCVTLNPNPSTKAANPDDLLIYWPKYTTKNFTQLETSDPSATTAGGLKGLHLIEDTYRKEGMEVMTALQLEYPL